MVLERFVSRVDRCVGGRGSGKEDINQFSFHTCFLLFLRPYLRRHKNFVSFFMHYELECFSFF